MEEWKYTMRNKNLYSIVFLLAFGSLFGQEPSGDLSVTPPKKEYSILKELEHKFFNLKGEAEGESEVKEKNLNSGKSSKPTHKLHITAELSNGDQVSGQYIYKDSPFIAIEESGPGMVRYPLEIIKSITITDWKNVLSYDIKEKGQTQKFSIWFPDTVIIETNNGKNSGKIKNLDLLSILIRNGVNSASPPLIVRTENGSTPESDEKYRYTKRITVSGSPLMEQPSEEEHNTSKEESGVK